jgi:hypothetical protein
MQKDAWRCNNDEHINKNTDIECEICGEKRPIVKLLKYDLTDKFGRVKIIWELDNTESGLLIKKKEETNLDTTKGEIEIDHIKNKEEITLLANNPIATYSKTLQIILEKPEISSFKSDKDKVLENTAFSLFWEVKNAKSVSISNIGKVEHKGNIERKNPKTPYKIVAENDIGKVEQSLSITIIPLPKIKEFRSKQQKIEYGKETQIVWNVENSDRIELHWSGNMEVLASNGQKSISPAEHTIYKLIITALDGITKEEKELSVKVFKRIEFNMFSSSSILIPRGLENELNWNVDNAQHLVLRSSEGLEATVDAKQNFKFFPVKSANYWLEAKNDLFHSKSDSIRIEVDNAPQMTRIPSFFEENQIPIIDLKLPELQSILLEETTIEFERMIHPRRKLSVTEILNTILKK